MLDGARLRKEIRKLHPKEGKPFKIEVFESHVYLTTFQYNRVFKIDKFGRGGMTKVRVSLTGQDRLEPVQKQDPIYHGWDFGTGHNFGIG